jgi:hypothetical protein
MNAKGIGNRVNRHSTRLVIHKRFEDFDLGGEALLSFSADRRESYAMLNSSSIKRRKRYASLGDRVLDRAALANDLDSLCPDCSSLFMRTL